MVFVMLKTLVGVSDVNPSAGSSCCVDPSFQTISRRPPVFLEYLAAASKLINPARHDPLSAIHRTAAKTARERAEKMVREIFTRWDRPAGAFGKVPSFARISRFESRNDRTAIFKAAAHFFPLREPAEIGGFFPHPPAGLPAMAAFRAT